MGSVNGMGTVPAWVAPLGLTLSNHVEMIHSLIDPS